MIFLKMEKLLEHNTEVVSVKCSVICNGTSLGLYIQNLYALDVIIKSFLSLTSHVLLLDSAEAFNFVNLPNVLFQHS